VINNDNDVFDTVMSVQAELKATQLRKEHQDLQEAYDVYLTLLEKYGFWNKITK